MKDKFLGNGDDATTLNITDKDAEALRMIDQEAGNGGGLDAKSILFQMLDFTRTIWPVADKRENQT